jgi:hypothetical protein
MVFLNQYDRGSSWRRSRRTRAVQPWQHTHTHGKADGNEYKSYGPNFPTFLFHLWCKTVMFATKYSSRSTMTVFNGVRFVAVQCKASCQLRFLLVTQTFLQCYKEIRKVTKFHFFLSKYPIFSDCEWLWVSVSVCECVCVCVCVRACVRARARC